jgi:hypothetical protein
VISVGFAGDRQRTDVCVFWIVRERRSVDLGLCLGDVHALVREGFA